MKNRLQQLRNKIGQHEKSHVELKNENESLKARLNLFIKSCPPEDLNLQIINTNDILKETQDQLKKLEEHNNLLQNNLKSKPPPKGRLHKMIAQLRVQVQNKNKLLKERSNIPKVIVHLNDLDKRELKNLNVRKKVIELLEENKNRKEPKIHVHINDETLVDISDENIKLQLQNLLKEAKTNTKNNNNTHKKTLEQIKTLINDIKINNMGVHVHLDDKTAVEFIDEEVKNRILELIDNAESVVDKTNNLSILKNTPRQINYGNNLVEEGEEGEEGEWDEEEEEEEEEEDEEDEEGEEGEEDEEDEEGEWDEDDEEED